MPDPFVSGLEDIAARVQCLTKLASVRAARPRGDQHAPAPDYRTVEPCSCEESLALRARVKDLEACIARLAGRA